MRRKGKLVIGNSEELKKKLLELYHDSAMGGHYGVTATGRRLAAIVYWKGLWKTIREYVRQCETCQKHKYETIAPLGTLHPLPVPQGIFIDISIDFIKRVPRSQGKTVIMMIVDRLTKNAHFIGLSHLFIPK